jgi:transketolase
VRNRFADVFYELGKVDSRLAIVVADISPAGSIAKFREHFPARFINTGVAEQIMIGLCAGMAMKGLRPFAYTIATFALYRPFEFVRDDLAYQNLPVTVVGIGGGVTYSTLGATHHAMEDISIAASIPNMTVLAPCDPEEVTILTKWCALENMGGPVYMRLGKAGEPVITQNADPFVLGKVRYIQRGIGTCIMSYGVTVHRALKLAEQLAQQQGAPVSIVNCHTLKPLDKDGIAKILHSYNKVIVLEEHVPHGGLGSRVKEIAWDTQAPCKIEHKSLQDEFIHVYGSHDQLLAAHGL